VSAVTESLINCAVEDAKVLIDIWNEAHLQSYYLIFSRLINSRRGHFWYLRCPECGNAGLPLATDEDYKKDYGQKYRAKEIFRDIQDTIESCRTEIQERIILKLAETFPNRVIVA